ncbi:cytosol aminopeptidase-like [Harmonia axyridis]|uniref:cytosol aminopeptidase-like n=1 Tax=Harmonia axyridis TaxID=115357 RepID=UPI001E275352|nr:cytosol aminopeptidase-like [Harmonia axyridis]
MNQIKSSILRCSRALSGILKQHQNVTYRNISTAHVRLAVPSPADIATEACSVRTHKGLVIGLYINPDDHLDVGTLTPTGQRYNSYVNNRIMELLHFCGPPPSKGVVRIFYDVDKAFDAVAVVGLGRQCQGYDVFEQMDENKEAIRIAAAAGCQALQELHMRKICVDSFGHSESAAEGSALGVWLYQEKRSKRNQLIIPLLELHDDCDWTGWQIGLQKAAAQNLARQLMDTPANLMTPTSFAQNAVEVLCKSGVNVEVKVRGWAETNNMNAFLAVSSGSCEPPIFLEISYYGCARDERPVVLIGKGVTYNSGGLCLRNLAHQQLMRGEMSGAAVVVATCKAVAGLQLPLNVRGLIPLCENMPGCGAVKPGDVIKCSNGKSLFIESTKCAGRLALVDTAFYAQNFWPRFIMNVGAISACTRKSFGQACTVACTNSEALWEYMFAASMHTGDRVWRMPLWKHFNRLLTENHECDVKVNGRARATDTHYGGPCKVASFIDAFMPAGDWINLDTMGVMYSTGLDFVYLREGMSGRPTRTIIEFLSQIVCQNACA